MCLQNPSPNSHIPKFLGFWWGAEVTLQQPRVSGAQCSDREDVSAGPAPLSAGRGGRSRAGDIRKAQPAEDRAGGRAEAWELPGRSGRGEEGRSVQRPFPRGLQGGLKPDSGRKCELCPPRLCSGLAPPEHAGSVCVCLCVCDKSSNHQIVCNIIFGPCRDSIIHLHKQIAQTH